jgi:hypothetical protein
MLAGAMTNIQQVNIWVEAEAFLEGITEADIDWCARLFSQPVHSRA